MNDYQTYLNFATDFEAKVFTITKKEYLELPAVLLDFIRIFKNKLIEKNGSHERS